MTDPTTEYQEQFIRILDLFERHATTGVSVTAVAREPGITRISAAKYLELLAANGDAYMERFGQKKLYRRSHRLPLREIFDRMPTGCVTMKLEKRLLSPPELAPGWARQSPGVLQRRMSGSSPLQDRKRYCRK